MQFWIRLVRRWTMLVFGPVYDEITPHIRALRLLEEVLELSQAVGVTSVQAGLIVNQVYAKPKGDPYQELGGVMVTLLGFAETSGLNPECAFEDEMLRIMSPEVMNKVRNRNLGGDKIGFERS